MVKVYDCCNYLWNCISGGCLETLKLIHEEHLALCHFYLTLINLHTNHVSIMVILVLIPKSLHSFTRKWFIPKRYIWFSGSEFISCEEARTSLPDTGIRRRLRVERFRSSGCGLRPCRCRPWSSAGSREWSGWSLGRKRFSSRAEDWQKKQE